MYRRFKTKTSQVHSSWREKFYCFIVFCVLSRVFCYNRKHFSRSTSKVIVTTMFLPNIIKKKARGMFIIISKVMTMWSFAKPRCTFVQRCVWLSHCHSMFSTDCSTMISLSVSFAFSFQAYQKWKKEHEGSEPRLPGLTHLSNDQLFFLNFAQVETLKYFWIAYFCP